MEEVKEATVEKAEVTPVSSSWRTQSFAQKMYLIRRLLEEMGYTVSEQSTVEGVTVHGVYADGGPDALDVVLSEITVFTINNALEWLERYYRSFTGLVSAGVAQQLARYREMSDEEKEAFRAVLQARQQIDSEHVTENPTVMEG